MGVVKGFMETVFNKFYRLGFRKRRYTDMDSLQKDLDTFIIHYNNERTHQGNFCLGRTPMLTRQLT